MASSSTLSTRQRFDLTAFSVRHSPPDVLRSFFIPLSGCGFCLFIPLTLPLPVARALDVLFSPAGDFWPGSISDSTPSFPPLAPSNVIFGVVFSLSPFPACLTLCSLTPPIIPAFTSFPPKRMGPAFPRFFFFFFVFVRVRSIDDPPNRRPLV